MSDEQQMSGERMPDEQLKEVVGGFRPLPLPGFVTLGDCKYFAPLDSLRTNTEKSCQYCKYMARISNMIGGGHYRFTCTNPARPGSTPRDQIRMESIY